MQLHAKMHSCVLQSDACKSKRKDTIAVSKNDRIVRVMQTAHS